LPNDKLNINQIVLKHQPKGFKFFLFRLKTKVNYGWLAVPAMCDLLASTLAYISLNYIPPSIYQMLRGGAIISTAFMSKFFLKKKI